MTERPGPALPAPPAPPLPAESDSSEGAVTPALDPARQAKARQYAAISHRLFFGELVLGAALLVALLASGLSARLRDFAEAVSPPGWWGVALLVYLALLGLGYTVLSLPLDYYSGFVLPHRYGLSTETRRLWIADQVKGVVLEAVLGVPLALALYWLLRAFPETWWIGMASLLILLTVGIGQLGTVKE